MTNKELQDFSNFLCKDLKISPKGVTWTIKEAGKDSGIENLCLRFKNGQDVVILRQLESNLYPFQQAMESCDFIVITSKAKRFRVCFCEIKTTATSDSMEKAKNQIASSEIFFNYICRCYAHSKNVKENKFAMPPLEVTHMLFYRRTAKRSVHSKSLSKHQSIITHRIDMDRDDSGCATTRATIHDAYSFFTKKSGLDSIS